MTEWLHFHFSLSCIGEGNGNPLQYSCLENPRDGGAWWAVVYGVAQSRTRLKRLSSSSSSSREETQEFFLPGGVSVEDLWLPATEATPVSPTEEMDCSQGWLNIGPRAVLEIWGTGVSGCLLEGALVTMVDWIMLQKHYSSWPPPTQGENSEKFLLIGSDSWNCHLLEWDVWIDSPSRTQHLGKEVFPSSKSGCCEKMKVLVAQSCPILFNSMNCSPPGSSVHVILQARILEWVAFPSLGDLLNPGIKPRSLSLEADSLPSEPPGKP